MSIHHVECAALTRLPASTKLVLMAFADSADKDTRVAFPGLNNVMAWSGLRRARALAVTTRLVEQGYLQRAGGSRPGRRAEYRVFPAGCCPQHGRLDGYAGPDPRDGSAPVDPNRSNASTTADPNTTDRSSPPDVNDADGSSPPDPSGSATADPSPLNGSNPRTDGSNLGPERVYPRVDPSPPPPSVSPPPPARESTEAPCAGTSDGGGGGREHSGKARWVFDHLGPEWTLSAGQRERLTPHVLAALQAGWTPEALANQLGTNAAGVRNPYAVLRARLGDLPRPPRAAERPAQETEWCGRCHSSTHRLTERSDGRWERCPDCHPLRAKHAEVS